MTVVGYSQAYPISEEYASIMDVNPSMSRFSISRSDVSRTVAPKHMTELPELNVVKTQLRSSKDGKLIISWIIKPDDVKPGCPCVLLIHGGGFVFKAHQRDFYKARRLARQLGAIVIMPEYRLAYNTEYGTTLQDCMDAYTATLAAAPVLQFDPNKIILYGDNAGAFMCTKIALAAEFKPICLALVEPVVDCTMRTASMKKFTNTPVWNAEQNKKMWDYYLQGNTETSILDLAIPSNFPATYIETSEYDCLKDEGEILGKKIEAAGVKVVVNEVKGAPHGIDLVREAETTRRARASRVSFIRDVLGVVVE